MLLSFLYVPVPFDSLGGRYVLFCGGVLFLGTHRIYSSVCTAVSVGEQAVNPTPFRFFVA